MTTDRPPRDKANLHVFRKSDQIASLELPDVGCVLTLTRSIEQAMQSQERRIVNRACQEFLDAHARFYGVPLATVRILASRPLRIYESGWGTELFGDYDPEKNLIRVWMRTAIRKQVTSFATLLSTLCHEFCHQLDFQHFRFPDSPHTRGFYERAALLYHHARGTPKKRLFWIKLSHERFRIDWARTRSGV